mgnify:CR=1 FL=1
MPQLNNEDFEKRREKWKQLVESEEINAPKINDTHMKGVVYQVLENTERELNEATQTGDIAQYTPVLMSLIRRTMPSLVGNQMVGVQSMSAPTGRIFAQHVYYGSNKNGGTETWANGTVGTATAIGAAPKADHTGPYTTEKGEALGWQDGTGAVTIPATDIDGTNPVAPKTYGVTSAEGSAWPEMSFAIDYIDVSVKTRALKGKLTTEVISDLRAVHGLDAEQEIANILQAEIVAEIDREIVNRIGTEAKAGAQNCATKGVFDFSVDADGRWSMEKVQGLLIQIEREATLIAQETRRGRGNFILTSPEVAAWLSMANLITNEYGNVGFTPVVNPVGISYYGTLTNRFKVYVDPYATATGDGQSALHTIIVGYKGANAYDAGIFYCPYIPLQFFKAQGQEDFGLRLGIKSRYGLVSNPYYCASSSTEATAATNSYYRKFSVKFSS